MVGARRPGRVSALRAEQYLAILRATPLLLPDHTAIALSDRLGAAHAPTPTGSAALHCCGLRALPGQENRPQQSPNPHAGLKIGSAREVV